MSRPPAHANGTGRSGVPQRIGDFEVIRTLGSGSFGKVKRTSYLGAEVKQSLTVPLFSCETYLDWS